MSERQRDPVALRPHTAQSVAALLLVAVFALLSILLVLLSTRVYQGVVSRAEDHRARQVAVGYLRNRLRAMDSEGALRVVSGARGDELIYTETWGDERYQTRIYAFGGALRELFTEMGADVDGADGSTVFALGGDGALRARWETPSLLALSFTLPDGEAVSVRCAMRCLRADGAADAAGAFEPAGEEATP